MDSTRVSISGSFFTLPFVKDRIGESLRLSPAAVGLGSEVEG